MNVRKGFTIIELLIVVAIIGILAGAVIVSVGDEISTGDNAAISLEVASALPKLTLAQVRANSGELCDELNGEGKITKINPPTLTETFANVTITETAEQINCLSIKYTWAIAGRLATPDEDGEYFCADSSDFRGPSDGIKANKNKAECRDATSN